MSAVSGIRGAIARFDAAAAQVSRAATASSSAPGGGPDTVAFSKAALDLQQSQAPQASLEDGLIDEMSAPHELAANVRVLNAADDMMQELVGMGSSRR